MTSHDQAEAFVALLPEGVMTPQPYCHNICVTLEWEGGKNGDCCLAINETGQYNFTWNINGSKGNAFGRFSGTEIPPTLLERIREISR